jgi:hypothetical protein
MMANKSSKHMIYMVLFAARRWQGMSKRSSMMENRDLSG